VEDQCNLAAPSIVTSFADDRSIEDALAERVPLGRR
jgi:hypothetical protein